MLRKIFSLIILVIFLTNSINFASAAMVQATIPDLNQKIYNSELKIKSLQNGSKYIIKLKSLNKFVKNQTDINLLTKIKLRLEEKRELIKDKDELTSELMYYIGLIVEKRITELEEIESKNIVKLLENSTLTSTEVKKVEDEIVKMQLNLLDASNSFVENLIKDVKKSLNVEKTGNLKLTVEGNGAMFGNGKGELNIKDMKSKAATFDSEFEAQVDLLVEASLVGGQELDTQFSSFINFISKDGNMYFLLQKLQYSGLDEIDLSGEYTSFLDKLKSLGDNNTYLKVEDKDSQKALEMIKNFDLNNMYNEANKVLSKPMLKPYKKDGDKYLLVPTKDFCDTIKYISYKFNHYGSFTCSDEEYNEMLQGSVVNGDLYIIVDGEDKHLGLINKQYGTKGYMKIYSSDKKIEKFLFYGEAIAGKDKGMKSEITFINGQKLDFIVFSDKKDEKINLSFKSLLTSTNEFSKIDHLRNFSIEGEGFNSYFKLDNKKFNGEIDFVGVPKLDLLGKISGSLDSANSLNSFDLSINSATESNKYNYDWNTGESNYTPTKSVFALNYSLKNEVITGKISFKENDVEMVSIMSNGKYRKGYFELNNSAKIIDDYSSDEVKGNLNAKYIGTLEDNTFDLYIDFTSKDGTVKIDLKTDTQVQYKDDIKIDTPTNYKNIEEIMGGSANEVQDSPEAVVLEFFE
ncbi:hypothetical protein EOM39_02990 [Candidatus Gracilibacteria bacterium]|nr:hypothetical protein [Candidatus Gracilibacteria bacterium]